MDISMALFQCISFVSECRLWDSCLMLYKACTEALSISRVGSPAGKNTSLLRFQVRRLILTAKRELHCLDLSCSNCGRCALCRGLDLTSPACAYMLTTVPLALQFTASGVTAAAVDGDQSIALTLCVCVCYIDFTHTRRDHRETLAGVFERTES